MSTCWARTSTGLEKLIQSPMEHVQRSREPQHRAFLPSSCGAPSPSDLDKASPVEMQQGTDEEREAYLALLKRVIWELHGCFSEHLCTAHVDETFDGTTVWQGDVEVFTVDGHPRAQRCVAWHKCGEPRVFAVMENTIVRTPLDAVKYAHVATSADLIREFSKSAAHQDGTDS